MSSDDHRRVLVYTLLTGVVHGIVALAIASCRASCGPLPPEQVYADVALYFDYASKAMEGLVPYRDYPVEYPVLSIPVFLVPRLFASDFRTYRLAFLAEMLLADLATAYLIARWVGREEGISRVPVRLGWYTLSVLSLGVLPISRFDFVPMLLAFAAACWWSSERAALGGVVAGLGMLVKVFPGVVAASTVAAEVAHSRRQRGRGLAALGLSLAVGLMLWAALGGRQAVQSLRYHTERGIEIGSLYSGLLLAVGKGTGAAVGHHYNHASEHIQAPGAITAAALAFPLQAAALLLVLWRSRCSRGADGVRYAGAAVLALLVAGKVLSPQYLIWILPFVTVQGGSTGARARWLLLTCCLATALLYPWAFDKLVALRWSGIILLNLRNALLLGLWGLLLFGREAPGIARTAAGGIVRGSHLRYNGQGNCANDPSPEPAGGPSLAAP